ncbi:hypothetical protein [Duncaniella muris]|uniref:hypothetical protein n=1 Tax=Duncaniella muris TaxID=2094150 RepID=UPI003F67661D
MKDPAPIPKRTHASLSRFLLSGLAATLDTSIQPELDFFKQNFMPRHPMTNFESRKNFAQKAIDPANTCIKKKPQNCLSQRIAITSMFSGRITASSRSIRNFRNTIFGKNAQKKFRNEKFATVHKTP